MKRLLPVVNKPIGESILLDLIENDADIRGIITEEKDGMGWWQPTKIREIAKENNIPLYPTHRMKLPDDFDVLLSIQYAKIFEKDFIDKFDYVLNLHYAELPRYRGMNSTSHAIMNARKDNWWKAGVAFHFIDHAIDTGKIIYVECIEFDDEILNFELYNLIDELAWKIYVKYRDYIINGGHVDTTIQRSLIDKDYPSYYYYANSLENKMIDLDQESFDRVWDVSRALYFPPFLPAQTIHDDEHFFVIPNTCTIKKNMTNSSMADWKVHKSGMHDNDKFVYLFKKLPDWYQIS